MKQVEKTQLVEFLVLQRKKCTETSLEQRTSQQYMLDFLNNTIKNKQLAEHYGTLASENEIKARTYQEVLDFIQEN